MELKEYLKLPYTRLIQEINDENGHYYYGRYVELDGCQSTGETIEELNENMIEALEGYIEIKLEKGLDIPLPVKENEYSGKFVLRIPKSLHMKLAIEAGNEGVSLNQYALYKLSK